MSHRRSSVGSLFFFCVCSLALSVAQAAGYWLPTGDGRLRSDLMLLVDEGVIRLPTNAWPIPVQDVRGALVRVSVDSIQEPALQNALLRVQQRVAVDEAGDDEWRVREATVTAGEPGLLRDFDSLGRENGELRSAGGATNSRWALNVAVTAALSPEDDQPLRFDGSDLTLRWGNWLFSANTLERWWGPGYESSLILSNNARPMPALSIDRARTTRSSVPILGWIGPWRFSAFVAALENKRADVNHPLFMGMRFSFKPAQILEFGLSRSAQFCGQGRPCGFSTFGRVILGRDNVGIRVSAEDEPGNQMAGADFRVVSPVRRLPFAFYGQLIGEDSSSSGIPERYLGLFGLEGWWLLQSGTAMRATVEYSMTSCKWYDPQPNANCAYRQGIFHAGYRYRDRNIGHTTDSDSEALGAALRLVRSNGEEWALRYRNAKLDRYGGVDIFNPLTSGPSDYESAELRWGGNAWNQDLSVQVGFERQRAAGGTIRDGAYGFIQWRRSL